MPSFITSKKKEKQWSKAKQAANKTLSEGDGDSYWALTNSIYQKMKKAKEELEKARPKMSDEHDPNEDPYESEEDPNEGLTEFDPDDEDSDADQWLKENDPSHGKQQDKYEEYGEDEDPSAHQAAIEEDMGSEEPDEAVVPKPQQQPKSQSRFQQPSREDLMAMRAYTRPWEQRARETAKLQADPSKNPVLAHQGEIIEAREKSHGDRKSAYQAFTNSKEYKNADPISQMEMDDKFEKDWSTKNPTHLAGAMQAHNEAHQRGKQGHDVHAAAKDAQIQNIISGGAQAPETFSTEAGLQHAGGAKGEEGTQGTIMQDPAASFAMGNQDFIRQYAQDYANKGKKPKNIGDIENYDEGTKKDVSRILGPAQAKDPKFEKFFSHYYPLIGMNANKTIKRLGLDPKHPDIDMSMLHEAGLHGLIQAMNDYDHDNPAKASFATHASNKVRGLQMTAMKNADQVPSEVRQAQKHFATQGKTQNLLAQSKHPAAPDMADRLKRVGAAKATQTVRRQAGTPLPSSMPTPQIKEEDDGNN